MAAKRRPILPYLQNKLKTHVTKPKVYSFVSEITPNDALELLTLNQSNRPVNEIHVTRLAHAIARGEWQLNGQAIIFSDTHRLIDGQHRLLACIDAEKNIETVVIHGVKDAAFDCIDTGQKSRSTADLLGLRGYTNTNSLAAAANLVALYKEDPQLAGGHRRSGPVKGFSVQQLIEFIDDNPGIVERVDYANNHRTDGASPATIAAAMYIFSCGHPDDRDMNNQMYAKVTEFEEALHTGANLAADSPILHLREKMKDNNYRRQAGLASYERDVVFGWFFTAWNYIYFGKPMGRKSQIRNLKKGTYPSLAGTPRVPGNLAEVILTHEISPARIPKAKPKPKLVKGPKKATVKKASSKSPANW